MTQFVNKYENSIFAWKGHINSSPIDYAEYYYFLIPSAVQSSIKFYHLVFVI